MVDEFSHKNNDRPLRRLFWGSLWLWFSIGTQTASAAIRELDRIIVNSMKSKDRTFDIVVEDITTDRRGKRSARPESQRPPKHRWMGPHYTFVRVTSLCSFAKPRMSYRLLREATVSRAGQSTREVLLELVPTFIALIMIFQGTKRLSR